MEEFPEEMASWRERGAWLIRDFVASARSTLEVLKEFLDFANGDSRQRTVLHYCRLSTSSGRPCCNSDREALAKMLSLSVQFFSRGYPCPLLYRWKHYGQASSFIKVGVSLFGLLPQALEEMQRVSKVSDEVVSFADALLADTNFDAVDPEMLARTLQESLDGEQNHAEQNKIRRQLVVEEIGRPSFCEGSMLIDGLIAPIEFGINYLLDHTAILHELRYAGSGHPTYAELKRKASDKFLHVVRGDFGRRLIGKDLAVLQAGLQESVLFGGLQPEPRLLNKYFQLSVLCLSDIHRRMVDDYLNYPYPLFNLLGRSNEEFVAEWTRLEEKHRNCPHCLDNACTRMLLEHVAAIDTGRS